MKNKISLIQDYLKQNDYDSYIIPSYENNIPLVVDLLGKKMLTRKLFLVIDKNKKPYLIAHAIDEIFLKDNLVDFDIHIYKTYQEMLSLIKSLFTPYKNVIMDVSENGLLPRISLADYGTVSFIKSLGVNIYSSGDILQVLTCKLNERNYSLMKKACELNLKIKDLAFLKIKEDILTKGFSDEYEIQSFITSKYKENNMVYDEPPIVAVNLNASNPHYTPNSSLHSQIKKGDVVLIDMWAKMNDEDAVYSDITWMGEVSSTISLKVEERFHILRNAVDKAVDFLKENLKKRSVKGYEVDALVHSEIDKSPYGEYFIHRTGHNISYDVSPHGPGVNIDNYECKDTRSIIKNIAFSLEPGIYYTDFGMRLETDVYIDDDYNPILVGGRQEEIIPILK